jgi:hypothetical protein
MVSSFTLTPPDGSLLAPVGLGNKLSITQFWHITRLEKSGGKSDLASLREPGTGTSQGHRVGKNCKWFSHQRLPHSPVLCAGLPWLLPWVR